MGFREFAKDYKVEYIDQPGRKRPKAVRVYVGPWYRFKQPPEKIRYLRWYYLISLAVVALSLLAPMCIDCDYTRTWYIQVPAAIAWIPFVFAACAVWRLWTAKERVDREHKSLLGDRMSGASLVLLFFCTFSFFGCLYATVTGAPKTADILVSACCAIAEAGAIAMLSRSKSLEMVEAEGPQK